MIDSYKGWPVVLDSNLLLLRWCATFDPALIKTYKRLNSFQRNDIALLNEILAVFGELRTTPHVLTEVSNLANQLPSWRKQAWLIHVAESVITIPEHHEPASEILTNLAFRQLGLTDAALSRLAEDHVILTIDWRLASMLQDRGLAGVNFQHLRSGGNWA